MQSRDVDHQSVRLLNLVELRLFVMQYHMQHDDDVYVIQIEAVVSLPLFPDLVIFWGLVIDHLVDDH